MGCFSSSVVTNAPKAMEILNAFKKSNDDQLIKFCHLYSEKNYNILKSIYQENDIVSQKLKQKIEEYIKIREEAKPIQIATSKCGNPCYAYQRKILFNCPKCDGKVNSDVENYFEPEPVFDRRTGRVKIKKNYKEKNICSF